MSLLPFLLELADEIREFNNGIDDKFNEIQNRSTRLGGEHCSVLGRKRHHPYDGFRKKFGFSLSDEEEVNYKCNAKDGFQLTMNAQQFKPTELSVKTVDNMIIIEGKHDDREIEHGFITRQFVRKCLLPKGYDPKDVITTMSSDGLLTVRAPPPTSLPKSEERIIEIQQTGPTKGIFTENNENKAIIEPTHDDPPSIDEPIISECKNGNTITPDKPEAITN